MSAPVLPGWRARAREILAAGLWCVVEVCVEFDAQSWEPRMLVCAPSEAQIAEAIALCVHHEHDRDVRIVGYTRDSLCRSDRVRGAICHLGAPVAAVA